MVVVSWKLSKNWNNRKEKISYWLPNIKKRIKKYVKIRKKYRLNSILIKQSDKL